jgi:transcriptional regulator of met regulon
VKKPAPGKLASLFADAEESDTPVISELLSDDQERRFCKNCRHNFITPFKCHCNLHQKEVEPLQDCPDFQPKNKISSI